MEADSLGQVRGVIWDWNGTLWDDTALCVEINNHMLRRRGLPDIDIHTYRAKLCFPVSGYYSQIGFDYGADPYHRLAEEFIEEYEQRRFECPLQPGARELVGQLHAHGVRQAVLSAYQHDTLLQAVDHFSLTRCFEDIIGLGDVYADGKVANGLKYIADRKSDPATLLFIGDTVHDFEVARAMGTRCVLVAHGHNSRSRLESCGVPICDSLAGVGELVARCCAVPGLEGAV